MRSCTGRRASNCARRMRMLALSTVLVFTVQSYGCALLIAGGAAGAAAGGASDVRAKSEHHSAMTYAGTVLANIPYFPAKVIFAGVGAAASGVSYVATLGKEQPADTIWDASVKGNYVLTPGMIEGRQPVHFVGTA